MNTPELSSQTPLIVGCWQFDDRSWQPLPIEHISHALDTYLALGMNQFDTADIYGRSERILGELLAKRDCKIYTKAIFWGGSPTASQVRHKIENSLRNLRRDTLDGLFVHWHDPTIDFSKCFETLQELVAEGIIQQLGVTNFNTPMLKEALKLAPIHLHQVQYSLIDRRVETTMQALCLQHQIGLYTYGAIAGGFLSAKFLNASSLKHAANHARGFYYNSMIQAHGGWPVVRELLNVLQNIAEKHQKTIPQVALNWVQQQQGVVGILCGFTRNWHYIQENAKALNWTLPPADVERLTLLSQELFDQPGDIYSYERIIPA